MQFQGFEPWSFTPSVERKGADVSIKVWKSLPQDHQEDETTRIAQNPKYRPKSLRIPQPLRQIGSTAHFAAGIHTQPVLEGVFL